MNKDTLLATLGCSPERHEGIVNTPVYRASTVLFDSLADYEAADKGQYTKGFTYGRYGTATSRALEETFAQLEGADKSIVTSSGLAAITTALLAFLKAGDHLLMTDSVYGPARRFCDHELKRFGVETTYYDPEIGAGIAALMKPNTKVIYTESPGSLSFEVQDIPAIAKAAHAGGAIVVSDSTWGTPYYYEPFALGVDISIHSATKYVGGHSDFVMGVISCKEPHYLQLLRTFRNIGVCPGSDNCFLALRGLRTMGVRLKQHYQSGLELAKWFAKQPEVVQVRHPALSGAPGHDIWKRDFKGACGLFSALLKPAPRDALAAMLDDMHHFGIGYSWGGFESLMIPVHAELSRSRTAKKWEHEGIVLRVHAGLEDVSDLIADLEQGFARMRKHG